jgi:two-component system cell cycle sensor histidine kinase/response regulator CckA
LPSWIMPAIVATLFGSLILVLVFLYLYLKENQRGLGVWALAWTLYSTRFLFELGLSQWPGAPWALVGVQFCALGSAYLLLWGSYLFVEAKMPRYWLFITGLAITWSSLAAGLKMPFMWQALPSFTYQGAIYGCSGLLWLRQKELTAMPARATGIAFIVWGLHKLNYPFLRNLAWTAPWGFLLGAVLEMIVALSTLLAYFEKAKRQVTESEARYRQLVENANEGIVVIQDEIPKLFNAKALAITGYTQEEFAKLGMTEFFHPDDRAMILERHRRRLAGEEVISTYEFRIIDEQGLTKWLRTNAVRIEWKGRPAVLSILDDITERKKIHQALAESEERVRQIAENIKEVFWLVSPDWRQVYYVSPAYEEVWQRSAQSLRQNPLSWMEALPVEDQKEVTEYIAGIQGREIKPGEFPLYRVVRPDGSLRWMKAKYFPVRNKNGEIYRMAGIAEDITETKLSRLQLDNFFNLSRDLLCIAGLDGYFKRINPSFEKTLGYSAEELLARPFLDFVHPEDRQPTVLEIGSLKTGQPTLNFINRYRTKKGSYRWLSWVSQPSLEDGLIYAVARDVTEAKEAEQEKARLEEQLRQAQKMEAIGVLAGGIAHDFNNILAIVLGYAEMTLDNAKSRGDDTEDLLQIIRAAHRARELVKQILTFSRKVEHHFKPLDLNREVLDTIKVLERTLPKMVAIHTDLASGLAPVNADPNQIGHVLINLASNAADAMSLRGELRLGTKSVSVKNETCLTCGGSFSGDYILLTVSDTGQGMDRDTLSHIFDPFYTTKGVGKGTGLGLSMVYGIVKDHGGHIQCRSAPGQGTTFRLFFPLCQSETALPQVTPQKRGRAMGGGETILLVDDEKALCNLGKQILGTAGYLVIVAGSGEEALQLFGDLGRGIDLVVLDLNMPGMGGLLCLQEMRRRNPAAKVIIASGYVASEHAGSSGIQGAAGFVPKPYRRDDMLQAVRGVLDS